MNRWTRLFPLLTLIILAACSSDRAVIGEGAMGPPNLNVLSARQIAHYDNALQAVKTMRSQWLRERSPIGLVTSSGGVRVFCDGMDVGGVAVLQYMSTQGIAYIRYYNGIEASWRWGLGHENGVIFVSNQEGLGPGGAR